MENGNVSDTQKTLSQKWLAQSDDQFLLASREMIRAWRAGGRVERRSPATHPRLTLLARWSD